MTAIRRRPLFVFGTLMDPDVLRIVLGRAVEPSLMQPATLGGHRVMRVADESYPVLVPDPAASAEGALLSGLSGREWDRIRFFEAEEYVLRSCRVVAGAGSVEALFCSQGVTSGVDGVWSLSWWQRRHKPLFMRMIEPYMALFGVADLEQAEALWSELQQRIELKRSA